MTWYAFALLTNGVLGTILVARLLSLRLHRVYRLFCAYVILIAFSSPMFFIERLTKILDYRILYLAISVVEWGLILAMVYTLLDAILGHLLGILKFSHRLLVATFASAALIAVVSAGSELYRGRSFSNGSSLALAVVLAVPLERVVNTLVSVALLVILAFILWFPVQLPRNLVFFSTGFVAKFVSQTVLLLLRGILPASAARTIDLIDLFSLSLCLGYFLLVINKAGESIPLKIGHRWNPSEQQRLVYQLDQINMALLKTARTRPAASDR